MIDDSRFWHRCGFWRRVVAFTLDCVLAGIVVGILGTIAFTLTGGRVQIGSVGLGFSSCVDSSSLPRNLAPPPPENSNYASVCAAGSLPGAISKRYLLVGRRTTSPGRIVETFRSYPLSSTGHPIDAFDAAWVGQLSFLVYFAACLAFRGRTIGMRALRARLVVLSKPAHDGVPMRRVLLRFAVAIGGFVPALLLAVIARVWSTADPHTAPVTLLVIATLVAVMIWLLYNIVLIVRKDDPVYDRVAGVAVVVG